MPRVASPRCCSTSRLSLSTEAMVRPGAAADSAGSSVHRGAGVLLSKVLANADTQQILACHCEERSDVAIRNPAEGHSKIAVLRANSLGVTNLP